MTELGFTAQRSGAFRPTKGRKTVIEVTAVNMTPLEAGVAARLGTPLRAYRDRSRRSRREFTIFVYPAEHRVDCWCFRPSSNKRRSPFPTRKFTERRFRVYPDSGELRCDHCGEELK